MTRGYGGSRAVEFGCARDGGSVTSSIETVAGSLYRRISGVFFLVSDPLPPLGAEKSWPWVFLLSPKPAPNSAPRVTYIYFGHLVNIFTVGRLPRYKSVTFQQRKAFTKTITQEHSSNYDQIAAQQSNSLEDKPPSKQRRPTQEEPNEIKLLKREINNKKTGCAINTQTLVDDKHHPKLGNQTPRPMETLRSQ